MKSTVETRSQEVKERRRVVKETGARRERGEHGSSVVSGGGHCSSFGNKRGWGVGGGGVGQRARTLGWEQDGCAPSWPRQGPRRPGPVLDNVVLLLALLLQLEDPLLQPVDHLPGDHTHQANRGNTARPPRPRPPLPHGDAAGPVPYLIECPPHSLAGVSSRLGAGGQGGREQGAPLLKGRHPREEGRDTHHLSHQARTPQAQRPRAAPSPAPSPGQLD